MHAGKDGGSDDSLRQAGNLQGETCCGSDPDAVTDFIFRRLVCCAFQVLEADSMSVFHIQFLHHFDTSQDVNICAQAVGRCPMQRRITVETKIFKIITQTQPKVLEPLEARGKITQLTQLNATNSN